MIASTVGLVVVRVKGSSRVYENGFEWYDNRGRVNYIPWDRVTEWYELDAEGGKFLSLSWGSGQTSIHSVELPGYNEWIGYVKCRLTQAKRG